MSENIKIYDSHVHYLWRDSLAENSASFATLQEKGLQGMALIIMGHHLSEPQKCFDFIPHSYHDRIGRHLFANSSGMDLPSNSHFNDLETIPYLDSRYITKAEADLSGFREVGFKGLKLLYVPDEDETYGMVGWKRLFDQSHKEYEKLTLHMIDQAVEFGWPVIFHADLRLHEGFAREVLETYANHPFIFPHFGFSRKIMAGFIEQFNDCYTDFSSLLPFMRKTPDRYTNFIKAHEDRILFGSDATIDWTDLISEYIETTQALIRDEGILRKVFQDNFLKVHQDIKIT